MNNPFEFTYRTMLVWQIILVLSFIYFLFVGTWQQWIIVFVISYIRTITNTVIIHRYLAHKAFKTHKWIEYLLSFISLGGANISIISWVATHRKHHRYPDQLKDPHSPQHDSIFNIYSRFKNKNAEVIYAVDIIKSKFYMFCHRWHWAICLLIMSVCYIIEPRAVLYAWLVPNFIGWLSSSSINSFNHLDIGYRNYETKDHSNNLLITGYLVAGEGWHNNHHNDPANPNFGAKWWEFDSGWWLIKLIRTDK